MSEEEMLICLICFVLGFMISRMMKGNGLMVGGNKHPDLETTPPPKPLPACDGGACYDCNGFSYKTEYKYSGNVSGTGNDACFNDIKTLGDYIPGSVCQIYGSCTRQCLCSNGSAIPAYKYMCPNGFRTFCEKCNPGYKLQQVSYDNPLNPQQGLSYLTCVDDTSDSESDVNEKINVKDIIEYNNKAYNNQLCKNINQ